MFFFSSLLCDSVRSFFWSFEQFYRYDLSMVWATSYKFSSVLSLSSFQAAREIE